MPKIKKYNVQELVRYARKYERYISNKDHKKDLLYESKKHIMQGQLEGKIFDYNLELKRLKKKAMKATLDFKTIEISDHLEKLTSKTIDLQQKIVDQQTTINRLKREISLLIKHRRIYKKVSRW